MKTKITISLLAVMFLFGIANSQTVETIGMGVYQTGISTLTLTDLGNIDHVVVEAIFKATEYYVTPNEVIFSDGDESYTVMANPVEELYTQNGTGYNLSPGYFQATFNSVDAGGITLNQLTNIGHIHSLIAYVYRNVDNGFTSEADMNHGFYFWNGENTPGVYSFSLDVADEPRDFVASIVISELSDDARIGVITVSAGGVSVTDTVSQPDPALGQSLNIFPINLYDVPGDATELTISIYSPSTPYNAGDSFIVGGVVLDEESPAPPAAPEICTLKQTFYGDYNGDYNGQTTSELLFDLLATDLVIGEPGHSLTLTQDNADCLIGRLPGGGPARIIHADATCENPIGIQLRYNGRFRNGLLSQAITLGLNLRLDGDLGSLLLSDISFLMHNRILQNMDADATVNDLFILANSAIAGGNTLGIRKKIIRNGMRAINAYFVGCVTMPTPGGDDCGPCNGQMTSLSLVYLGDVCDATVRVYKNHISCSNHIATFSGVYAGDTLTFTGTGNWNKLGAKVKITIDDNYCNITEIHTSCSQPIEVGMVYNDEFLLVAGISHDGGPLCDDGFKSGSAIFDEFDEISILVPETNINVYPNPIVSGSSVEFEVSQQGNTVVEVVNLQGQVVKQLFNGDAEPGSKYSLLLNAKDLDKGIYFLRMQNGTEIITEKISILN